MKPPIDENLRITFNSDVVFQRFDDKAIVVNLKTEELYKLNDTGAQVAELISEEISIGEILQALQQTYEADFPEIEQDVYQLLVELSTHKLILESPPTPLSEGKDFVG